MKKAVICPEHSCHRITCHCYCNQQFSTPSCGCTRFTITSRNTSLTSETSNNRDNNGNSNNANSNNSNKRRTGIRNRSVGTCVTSNPYSFLICVCVCVLCSVCTVCTSDSRNCSLTRRGVNEPDLTLIICDVFLPFNHSNGQQR